jgi:hypothetical protein
MTIELYRGGYICMTHPSLDGRQRGTGHDAIGAEGAPYIIYDHDCQQVLT